MALIDRVKERTGSDLSDTELQAMIDGIADEMELRFGPAGPVLVLSGDPADPATQYRRTLRLVRAIDTAEDIEIVEIDPGNSGDASARVTLAADDYRVLHGGRTLQRLISGTNGREFWAPMVELSYTPKGEQAAREEATIQLMQLQLSYRGGLKSERAGDYSFTLSGDMGADREKIFEGLAQRRGMVMA
jgi:hypothetical protein